MDMGGKDFKNLQSRGARYYLVPRGTHSILLILTCVIPAYVLFRPAFIP